MSSEAAPGRWTRGLSGGGAETGAPTFASAALVRAGAEALDAADPLAPFRDRFVPDAHPGRIYLDGNSLGRPPRATAQRIARLTEQWARDLVGAWPEWIDLPARAADLLADGVLGAHPGEVLVADSTTVNLYKLAAAALEARPDRGAVVADAADFPTDRYVLEGLTARTGHELRLLDSDPVDGPTAADVTAACSRGDVALVCLSLVAYRSGALADMAQMTAAAHAGGALALWDLSHAAGAVPIDLDGADVDLAVGCTYKYLSAGPGAPAFLYVNRRLQPRLRSPIWGWFGQREQFAMGPAYDPAPGIGRFAAGTPPILGVAAVEEGAGLVAEAGLERLRRKSTALTELLVALHDAWLVPHGFALGTPRETGRRGSHVALRHGEGWRIARALVEHASVVPDFRGPDSIRLAVAPLYTRFTDVWDALDRLRGLMERGDHLAMDPVPGRVT